MIPVPCTWKELSEYHNSIVDVKIQRTPEILQEYEEYKKTEEYKNFGLQTLKNKVASKSGVLFSEALTEVGDDVSKNAYPCFVILKNDFPYHLEPNIHHYVAWYIGSGDDGGDTSIPLSATFALYKYLGAILGTKDRSYCVFQNSMSVRTIHTILHVHLFIHRVEIQECVIPC